MALLNKISELEQRLLGMCEPKEDLENELLRAQLDQHRNFVLGFMDQVTMMDEQYKGELSKQGRDFAKMTMLRLVTESQQNKDGMWHMADVRHLDNLVGGTDATLQFHRPGEWDKVTTTGRMDMVIPKVQPKPFRDLWSKPWHDLQSFRHMFGDDIVHSFEELPEFRVDEELEQIHAYHAREHVGDLFRDHVYLVCTGEMDLSKSTLQMPPGRGPVLSQVLSNQHLKPVPFNQSATGRKRQKQDFQGDPVEWGICGQGRVFYAVRSHTSHGDVRDSEKSLERVVSVNMEGVLVWKEDIDSADPNLAGSSTRVIWLGMMKPDFRWEAVGGPLDHLDQDGVFSERAATIVKNYLELAISLLSAQNKH